MAFFEEKWAHPQDTIIVLGQARKTHAIERQRELSEARAKAVIRALVEDYHIHESRIINGLTVKGFQAVFDADVAIIFEKQKTIDSVKK